MLLRPRQKLFVERSLAALSTRDNTLGVAPTGAGKTIMLSAVTGNMTGDGARACVLAHRDELTSQNRAKFARVNPDMETSVVDATTKSWEGQVTFAMAPTLSRAANLQAMPKLDLLVIDEAHHAVAESYRRIIDRVREANPDARIFGVTATPNRGDRKGLREVFDNVADHLAGDRREHDGLARTGGRHAQRVAAGSERSHATVDEGLLAGAQAHGRSPPYCAQLGRPAAPGADAG